MGLMDRNTFRLRVPPDVFTSIQAEAKRSDVPMARLMRRAWQAYMESLSRPRQDDGRVA